MHAERDRRYGAAETEVKVGWCTFLDIPTCGLEGGTRLRLKPAARQMRVMESQEGEPGPGKPSQKAGRRGCVPVVGFWGGHKDGTSNANIHACNCYTEVMGKAFSLNTTS